VNKKAKKPLAIIWQLSALTQQMLLMGDSYDLDQVPQSQHRYLDTLIDVPLPERQLIGL
jgi:hypothetical protein